MNWILLLVILLICPLMHFWMMRKNSGHGHEADSKKVKKDKKKCCH